MFRVSDETLLLRPERHEVTAPDPSLADLQRLQGACLYVPATHRRLDAVLCGAVPAGLGVVVVCLEDSITSGDVEQAMAGLRASRRQEPPPGSHELRVYVRPRSPEMLAELLDWEDAGSRWSGFVLPKIGVKSLRRWMDVFGGQPARVMPILETADVFCPFALRDLADAFVSLHDAGQLDAVRLGATDLFSVLGTRRPSQGSLYSTHLGSAIAYVACNLMSRGLPVAAPVCERLDPSPDMAEEVRRDVDAGFIGKTAVNVQQVELINSLYAVTAADLTEAELIVRSDRAVFRHGHVMCEVSPHRRWAESIRARYCRFGLRPSNGKHVFPDQVSGSV